MDYMKFVRDQGGNYLERLTNVTVEGMLFTDVSMGDENREVNLLIESISKMESVQVIGIPTIIKK